MYRTVSSFLKYFKKISRRERRIRIEERREEDVMRAEKERGKKNPVYIYIHEEAASRTVAGWQAKGAAKLKFLRSSDDAATHKKFKRFILVGGPRRASLAFFPI